MEGVANPGARGVSEASLSVTLALHTRWRNQLFLIQMGRLMEITDALMSQRHPLVATTNKIKYLRTTVHVYTGVQEVVLTPFPGGDGVQDLGDQGRSFTVLSEEVQSP